MSNMIINQKRCDINKAYNDEPKWTRKTDRMSDYQILAIWNRLFTQQKQVRVCRKEYLNDLYCVLYIYQRVRIRR